MRISVGVSAGEVDREIERKRERETARKSDPGILISPAHETVLCPTSPPILLELYMALFFQFEEFYFGITVMEK